MGAHVVVSFRRHFETARVTQLGATSVRLTGGWPDLEDSGPLSVLVGECEVQARIVEKGPRYLRLAPSEGAAWPLTVHRALLSVAG